MARIGEKTEKRSVTINGRKTSLTIKPSIWTTFVNIAKAHNSSAQRELIELNRQTNGMDLAKAVEQYVRESSDEPLYNFATREQWLASVVEAMRPVFAARGHALPDNIKVSIGFPSTGYRGKQLGECWPRAKSAKGWTEIFISPVVAGEEKLANILTHELCHASIDCKGGHGKAFKAVGEAMSLEGKAKHMQGGAAWRGWSATILEAVGPIPHAALAQFEAQPKKQTTRLVKCECPVCGFAFRTTRKWLEGKEHVTCPDSMCGARIHLGELPEDEGEGDE